MRICSARGCSTPIPDDRKDKCCKSCRTKYSAAWRQKNLDRSREIARVSKRKERSNFANAEEREAYLARQRAITNRCRDRHREAYRARMKAYQPKAKAAKKAKRLADPDEARRKDREDSRRRRDYRVEWQRRNYAKNRDKIRTRAKECRLANVERYRATDRARYMRDRFKRILGSEKARARRAGAAGSHTVAEWKSVLRHYGRKCIYCSVPLTIKNISKDHRTPLSRGGTNNILNIVPACRTCNSKKNARTYEEYMSLLNAVSC